jgi:hypothetical protein
MYWTQAGRGPTLARAKTGDTMTSHRAGITRRHAALGLLAATAGLTEDYADGPSFQKEIVEAYDLIGKAIAK